MEAEIAVWKYTLAIDVDNTFDIPVNAQILHAAFQKNAICLWALVDTNERKEQRRFYTLGTGHISEHQRGNLKHISSILTPDQDFVFHVFEVIE